jgi:hypothetical protein
MFRSSATSCIRIPPPVICGITTGAATRGNTELGVPLWLGSLRHGRADLFHSPKRTREHQRD